MLLSEILEKKDEIHKIVQKNKGNQVKVFGSTINGNATDQSDLDFLVKFREDASLFDLVEIKLELEELFNKKVDVISEDGLKNNEVGRNISRSALLI